jgi:homocitrate synthase
MARMIVADRDYVLSKYKLHKLKDIEELVADAVEVNIPFSNCEDMPNHQVPNQ